MSLVSLLSALFNFAVGSFLLFGVEHPSLLAKYFSALNLVLSGISAGYALAVGCPADESEEKP